MHESLKQFLIKPIYPMEFMGYDISFTNSSFFMMVAVGLVMALQYFGTQKRLVVPNRLQSLVEGSYDFVSSMVKDTAGREGLAYFPLVFSLFMFVLMANLLGMIPYSFTVTSHIIVTLALALLVFVTVTLVGIYTQGFKFFRMFFPEGTPIAIAPILVPIEIISYCLRPITLSVRLFVNMLAGHILMKVIAGFAVALVAAGSWAPLAILPTAFNIVFIGFEFFVACIQAFIFTILTCLYLHDALHAH